MIGTLCGETSLCWYKNNGKITFYSTWPLIRYEIETGDENDHEFKAILAYLEKLLIKTLPKYTWGEAAKETRKQKIKRKLLHQKPRMQRSIFNWKTKEFTDIES